MFAQLTKLLDRNFTVGYFLPSVLFVGVSCFLFERLEPVAGFLPWSLLWSDLWQGLGVGILVSWLLAVSLLAANKRILRFKEGYGWWNRSGNPFLWWQRRRFRKLQAEITRLEAEVLRSRAEGDPVASESLLELSCKRQEQIASFPHDEKWVLPFAFGNTLRAFEVYPGVMYGFDAIPGWSRLLAVIPIEFREQLDAAKSQMDFLINLWLLSVTLVFEWGVIVWFVGRAALVWFPALAVASAGLASFWARVAAVDWGDLVKASFDLYLPELRRRLDLAEPRNREEERRQWHDLTQAILYLRPEKLPPLARRSVDADERR